MLYVHGIPDTYLSLTVCASVNLSARHDDEGLLNGVLYSLLDINGLLIREESAGSLG